MPGRSALTVTPRTAAMVPMALIVDGHWSCAATMVVTASGGGWYAAPWAMAVSICLNFTKPNALTKSSVSVSITNIRIAMNLCPPLVTVDATFPGLPANVQEHPAVDSVPISGLLAEKGWCVVLRLQRDKSVITPQAPAPRVPAHAASDIAGEERFAVVDAERRLLQETQSANPASYVRDD